MIYIMTNIDMAWLCLGLIGIGLFGLDYFVKQEEKELKNRNCVCPKPEN